MKKTILFLAVILNVSLAFCSGTEYIKMSVGEKRTLSVPSYVTSKTLRTWSWNVVGTYSVKITSKGVDTCTIEALSETGSSGVVVQFYYEYLVASGSFTYSARDYYDFNVVVRGSSSANQTVKLDCYSIGVDVGEVDFKLLTATVSPGSPGDTITWKSSNTAVLTVKSGTSTVNGQKKFYCYVTTKNAGSSTITAIANGGASASCKVTVLGHTYSRVFFHPNWGGQSAWSKSYIQEEIFGSLPTLIREGYSFAGWYTDAGKCITASSIMPSHDVDLYAKWTENAYSVRFDANGGVGAMMNESFVFDTEKSLTANSFTRPGYTFAGWAQTANGDISFEDRESVKNLTAKQGGVVVLYAKWNAIKYTVKFNANYGTGSAEDMICAFDTEYSTPTEGFSNGDKKLVGWSLSPLDEIAYKCGEKFKNLTAQDGKIITLCAVYKKSSSVELRDLYDEYGVFAIGKEIVPIDFGFAAGWKIAGLPAGLKYNAKTGLITGKPTKSGVFKVTLTRTSDKTIATTTFEVMSQAEDKAAIEIKIGEDMRPDAADDEFAALTLPVGVAVNWPIEATALSATTVKVAGLPAGLKLVQDKITKEYSIQGTPTAASKVDKKTGAVVPSLAKFTVTTAGKNSRVFTMPITTTAMEPWAVGTFNGGLVDSEDEECGLVTLTTTAAGKISGKILKNGQTWTVSAVSFDSYDEEGYHATLTAKSGKLDPETYEIVISEEGAVGSNEYGEKIEAYWNFWKTAEGKLIGKELAANPEIKKKGLPLPEGFDLESYGLASLTLKFAASGAVTATGMFDIGAFDKKGNPVYYKATCSTVLIPTESGYRVYLYFAPNAKKNFDGNAFVLEL